MDISLGFIAAAIAIQLLVFYLPDVVSASKESVAKLHGIFYVADLLIFLVWLKLLLLCF